MAAGDRIAIVGLGLIGGSLALALRRARPEVHILGIDSNPLAVEQALEENAIDSGADFAAAALDGVDLVVLAVPAQALIELLPQVAARMRAGAVLTDVCGAKEAVCAAGALQSRVLFVGGHPMAGTEFSGFVAATPGLFADATVVLCPPCGGPRMPERARSEASARVRSLWLLAGAGRILDLDPVAHDRAVALASHVPYLAAAAVVELLVEGGQSATLARDLAAGGFRDTTRLAGDGTVGGAAALNRFVPDAGRQLAERLRQLADALEGQPAPALGRLGKLAELRRKMRLPTGRSSAPPPPRK